MRRLARRPAGLLALQVERPAGAAIQFEFADLADAILRAQAQVGGGQRLEAFGDWRVDRVFADQAFEGGQVAGFEGFGDPVDELGATGGAAGSRGVGGGAWVAEVLSAAGVGASGPPRPGCRMSNTSAERASTAANPRKK